MGQMSKTAGISELWASLVRVGGRHWIIEAGTDPIGEHKNYGASLRSGPAGYGASKIITKLSTVYRENKQVPIGAMNLRREHGREYFNLNGINRIKTILPYMTGDMQKVGSLAINFNDGIGQQAATEIIADLGLASLRLAGGLKMDFFSGGKGPNRSLSQNITPLQDKKGQLWFLGYEPRELSA